MKTGLSVALQKKMHEFDVGQIEERRRMSRNDAAMDRRRAPGRNCSSDIVHFDVHAEDDLAVRAIKEAINESRITLDSVYERVGRGAGWNLYYGLLTRRTTTMKTFIAWGEILGLEPAVTLTNRPA